VLLLPSSAAASLATASQAKAASYAQGDNLSQPGLNLGKCLPCGFNCSIADGTTDKSECFAINSRPPKAKGRLKVNAGNIMAKVRRSQQRMLARQQAAEGLDVVILPDSPPPRPDSAVATIAQRAADFIRSGLA
jgi:hypothetical protein